MEDLIASLRELKIVYPEVVCPSPRLPPTRQTLVSCICHLYNQNFQLKQEIERLRRLLEVVDEPCIPEWVH